MGKTRKVTPKKMLFSENSGIKILTKEIGKKIGQLREVNFKITFFKLYFEERCPVLSSCQVDHKID